MTIWSLLLFLQGELLPSSGHAWLLHHKIIRNLPLFNVHSFTCSLLCSANKTTDFPLPQKSAHWSPSVTQLSRAPPSAFPVKSRKTYITSSFVTSLDANSTKRTFHGHSICKMYPCFPSHINLIFSFQVIILSVASMPVSPYSVSCARMKLVSTLCSEWQVRCSTINKIKWNEQWMKHRICWIRSWLCLLIIMSNFKSKVDYFY